MQDDITNVIHQLATSEIGIYSSLFGFEGFDIEKKIEINWAFNTYDDLEETLKLFLDHLIATILNSYDLEIDKELTKKIIYLDTEYTNLFLNKGGYDMMDVSKICDLENIIDDINVIEIDDYICFNISLPIYKIQF